MDAVAITGWCVDLPRSPKNLLEQADFKLTGHEAGFLVDRLVNAQPKSLLAHLGKARRHAICDYVWEHPDYASFPDAARRLIRHAEVFSAVMHGAALLYNLMLAELREMRTGFSSIETTFLCGRMRNWTELLFPAGH